MRNFTNSDLGWFFSACFNVGMLIGIEADIDNNCFIGLWGLAGREWPPPQEELTFRKVHWDMLHPNTLKLLLMERWPSCSTALLFFFMPWGKEHGGGKACCFKYDSWGWSSGIQTREKRWLTLSLWYFKGDGTGGDGVSWWSAYVTVDTWTSCLSVTIQL